MTEEISLPAKLVCALGVSHRDAGLAESWLRWASFLAAQPNGDQSDSTLVIMGSQRVSLAQWKALRAAIQHSDAMFKIDGAVCPDELETGYPISASHLFLRTMEYCEATYPGAAVLWCEADTVPMRPGWFTEIEFEYAASPKPFMGVIERGHGTGHLAGVAVYPPDWRGLAPRLAGVLRAPDIKQWGPKKGQAFDTYAAVDTVSQAHEARTIQQIWRPQPFNKALLSLIKPETALFHQSKDGKLIETLALESYPEYCRHIVVADGIFALRGHHHKAVLQHEVFPVAERVMRLKGGWWSLIKPTTMEQKKKLLALCEPGMLEEVTEAVLAEEKRKRQKVTRIQHV